MDACWMPVGCLLDACWLPVGCLLVACWRLVHVGGHPSMTQPLASSSRCSGPSSRSGTLWTAWCTTSATTATSSWRRSRTRRSSSRSSWPTTSLRCAVPGACPPSSHPIPSPPHTHSLSLTGSVLAAGFGFDRGIQTMLLPPPFPTELTLPCRTCKLRFTAFDSLGAHPGPHPGVVCAVPCLYCVCAVSCWT